MFARQAGVRFDNERAFTGITQLATSPQLLCVHPSVPVHTFAEFLAYARARPGELPFSTSGIGGTSHLAIEMPMAMAGISMLHVPYRGGGPSAQAVIAGETQLTFIDVITALPFIQEGRVRPLGVSTRTRAPLTVGGLPSAVVTVTEPKAEELEVMLVEPSTATAQLSSTACACAPVYQSTLAAAGAGAGRSAASDGAASTDGSAAARPQARIRRFPRVR